MEPRPAEIIEKAISAEVNSGEALSWLAKIMGRPNDITINMICWMDKTIRWPGGGISLTEYSYFFAQLGIKSPSMF